MKNFGEILINPEKEKVPQQKMPSNETGDLREIEPIRKKDVIEHIQQFDKVHHNKELTPEQKKSRRNKIYTGLALIALSGGGYLYEKYEDYFKKADSQKELVAKESEFSKKLSDKSPESKQELSAIKERLNQEYQKQEKEKNKPETRNDNPPSKERLEKAHRLTIEVQAISRNLLKKDDFFPKKIFSSDFLLAIQAQESGFEKGAQSHKGAVGSMQVMPETIKETLLYINKIDNRLSFEEKDITKEFISDIIYLIKQNPELGKAFGNLYLAEIFNNFEIGKKSLENNWITLGRKKILATYNWGIRKFMKNAADEENWPNETKNYINNISADKKIFDQINSKLGIDENNKKLLIKKETDKKTPNPKETLSLKTNPEYIKEAIILEIRKFRDDKNIEFSKMNIEEIINYYLGEIKIKEQLEKKSLKKDEVKKIIKELNFKIFKNFVAKEGLTKERLPI